MIRYLRRRFDTEKVYLLAHSWGSFVGLQVAARAADQVHASIGMAQVTDQLESERRSDEYLLARYTEIGDRRMVRALARAPVTDSVPSAYDAIRDKAMHRLGVGTTRDMHSVVTGIFLPPWRSQDYTLPEKVNLWRGKIYSRRAGLWDQLLATDLTKRVTEQPIPAYFLHGRYDYTVSYPMAKAYASHLRAPQVGFYTFQDSAHSPAFEEYEMTRAILCSDELAVKTDLADVEEPQAQP